MPSFEEEPELTAADFVDADSDERVDHGSDVMFVHLVPSARKASEPGVIFDVPGYIEGYQRAYRTLLSLEFSDAEIEASHKVGVATVEFMIDHERSEAIRGELFL